jgi:hypothetical protein
MLMHTDRGGIDHLQIAVISFGNSFENPVPNIDFPPADKAVVASCRRTVAFRDIVPRRARAQSPIDAIQHLAIVGPWLASRLVRQERLDDRPLKIRQLVAACFHDCSSTELESHHNRNRHKIYEFVT